MDASVRVAQRRLNRHPSDSAIRICAGPTLPTTVRPMTDRWVRFTATHTTGTGTALLALLLLLVASTGASMTTHGASAYLSSSATATQTAVRVDPPDPRLHVLTIGDSAHAGIERNGAFAALRGAKFEVRGESCRRLVRTSCNLRGNGPPPTALATLQSTPYDVFDIVVLQVGHNDQMPAFNGHASDVYRAAKAAGIDHVLWLTQHPEFRSDLGGGGAYQVYERHNDVLRSLAAAHEDFHLVEWSAIARQRPQYLYPDGIHLRQLGGLAVADIISRAVAYVAVRPCPMPETPGALPLNPCPDPGRRSPVDVSALYDLSARIVPCALEGSLRETVCRWDFG